MREEYSGLRRSTLLIFLVCGLGMSSWAPMVLFAKERMGLNDASLGILLLALGAGAIIMMPITGFLIQQYGSRKVILSSSILMALMLPLLLILSGPTSMGIALFFFGASIGGVDVAMNAHAVKVQRLYGRHIMSSFHGLFSVGGLLGSLGLGALIKAGLSPVVAAVAISVLLLAIAISQYSRLLPHREEERREESAGFSWPNKAVVFLGLMCFIVFLAEGSILDWSAVFLQFHRDFDPALSGVGYAAFSIAMAVMRLSGDRLVSRISSRNMVVYGSLVR